MAEKPQVFQSTTQTIAAVVGENTAQGDGVFGIGHGASGRGVVGTSELQNAVTGVANQSGTGVWGTSVAGNGVFGETKAKGGVGVIGQNQLGGDAVFGAATTGGRGVVGTSDSGTGVWATSGTSEGVHAETNSPTTAAVAGFNLNVVGTGAAIYGKKAGNVGYAGYFDGDVYVSRSVTVEEDVLLHGADCAEEFNVKDPELACPGMVMIADGDGVVPCEQSYDSRVVGVISGAGAYRPAIVLDRRKVGSRDRCPIALIGKVDCLVDATFGAIEIGDLLTTSETTGHAMKAEKTANFTGSLIGKSLGSIQSGRGLISIIVSLQ